MAGEIKKEDSNQQFHLTLGQKIAWGVALLAMALVVVPLSRLFTTTVGSVTMLSFAILLGVLSWYISAGWTFRLELTQTELRIRDGQKHTVVPLDRLGLVARAGRIPFLPTVWLVLRGAPLGEEIPGKGVDPMTLELIESLRKRNPGKKITYVPLPGAYIRSVRGFVQELKRRIPPLTIDGRLEGK